MSEATLKFKVDDDGQGKKVLKAAGDRDAIKAFNKSISTILRTTNSVQHLHRSSLISLVSVVESFLSQLLHLFFSKHPSAINAKEKQFTFEELSAFASLDDARAYLVSWKIENLLRGSYEDWIDYFRGQLKLELTGISKHHDHLIENFQRRNLFVHNDGVVNKIYLSKLGKASTKQPALNKRLGVSKDYLFAAIDRFESSFLQLAYELWAKCDKKSEKRPSLIVHSSYDALLNSRWHVATEIADFVTRDKAADEICILMARINSWIARKKIDDKTAVIAEVSNFDVSAKDDLFKLAKHCLLDETDAAIDFAKQLVKTEKLSVRELTEWPLFGDLRATPQMKHWLVQLRSKNPKRKPKAEHGGKSGENAADTNAIDGDTAAIAPRKRKPRKPAPPNV